jgi:hypothetical protein
MINHVSFFLGDDYTHKFTRVADVCLWLEPFSHTEFSYIRITGFSDEIGAMSHHSQPVKATSAGFINFYRLQNGSVSCQKPRSRPSENTSTRAILWPSKIQNYSTGYKVGPPSDRELHFPGFMVDKSSWYSWILWTNKITMGGHLV